MFNLALSGSVLLMDDMVDSRWTMALYVIREQDSGIHEYGGS